MIIEIKFGGFIILAIVFGIWIWFAYHLGKEEIKEQIEQSSQIQTK